MTESKSVLEAIDFFESNSVGEIIDRFAYDIPIYDRQLPSYFNGSIEIFKYGAHYFTQL